MPLNYDLSKIKSYKRLFEKSIETGDSKMKDIPRAIVMSTMSVGMREITKDNYIKFYNRLSLLENVYGHFFYVRKRGKMIPRPIKLEEVERMIGLKTNASELSRSKFLSRIDKEKI
jgi:hypothetical protein